MPSPSDNDAPPPVVAGVSPEPPVPPPPVTSAAPVTEPVAAEPVAADPVAADPGTAAISDLIERALAADRRESLLEEEEARNLLVDLATAQEKQRALKEAVLRLRETFRSLLEQGRQREHALPEDGRPALASRKESLELCGRMLERLADRQQAEPAPEPAAGSGLLAPLTAGDLEALPVDDARVAELLRDRRFKNQQAVAALRTQAETARKKPQATVLKNVLPIVDGLDEGRKISVTLREELVARYPEAGEAIASWFRLYDELIEAGLAELASLGVTPLTTQRGDEVDYDRHEPVDVEPDPELLDEQVKEVVRRGYSWGGEAAGALLRTAQVIVAKNEAAGQ